MGQDLMEQVAKRWRHDETFRAAVRASTPHEAAKSAGFDLDEDDVKTLHRVDWNLTDEAIVAKGHKEVTDW